MLRVRTGPPKGRFSLARQALFAFLAAWLAACQIPNLEPLPTPQTPTDAVGQEPVVLPLPTGARPVEALPSPTPQPTAAPAPTPTPEPLPMMQVGIENESWNNLDYMDLLDKARTDLVRYNGVVWPHVETNEGDRNWENLWKLDYELENLAAHGVQIILIVRGTPYWARQVPGSDCGPVKPEKLEAFARFMSELVARYSIPPYNVHYWELGNEPDVDPSLLPSGMMFGCWGDKTDPYYGGEYYAEMLKAVYPAIKAADPQARVLIGGLLMDCDPLNPPEGKDCQSTNFFEGILRGGGAEYFDIVSFHGYSPFNEGTIRDEIFLYWRARGGVVLGKIDFLREVMAAYGVEKPIMLTEGGLICPGWSKDCNPPREAFFEAQADYVLWLYVRNWAEGLSGTIWYSFSGSGWRFGSMAGYLSQPKPAYRVFQFFTEYMEDARYTGKVSDYPELRGYAFADTEKKIWILWSPDADEATIDLPESATRVLDKFGQELAVENRRVVIKSPVYIELQP